MPVANVNGHELHYTDYPPHSGAEPALTIIFCHGLGSTQNFYVPVLPYLAAYRCIIFDNYGAGRSSYTGQEQSIPAIAKDVLALMDECKVDKAVVVGFSMCGMIPTYMAATTPDRVVAGICVGPVHPNKASHPTFEKRIVAVTDGGMEPMANTVPNSAVGSKAKPIHRAFIREMLLSHRPEGYIANCKAIINAAPPDYAKVNRPILIIAGEEDPSAPLDGCKKIFNEIATSQKHLKTLPGVGHWICVEAPEESGSLMKHFVEQL